MALLWPESDEPSARHLLADSIYLLRRALGRESVLTSGPEIRL